MKPLTLLAIIGITFLLTSFRGCKTKPQPQPQPQSCCIDFNSPASFPAGITYIVLNDSVYYSCSFTVWTDNLFIGGQSYYSNGMIKPATAVFGAGQVFNTNNMTLKFINTGTIKPVTITLDYLDMAIGGTENLSVNGNLYSGDISAAPATLGGATVSVTSTAIPLPAKGNKGTVTLTGTIKEFKIGGQEFYLDNICFQ